MSRQEIFIKTEFITLGALLKFIGIITVGSEASIFLNANKVLINGEEENRRGRKIYPNYIVAIDNNEFLIKSKG